MDALVKHKDLKKGYFDYNAWKPDSAFPIQTVAPEYIADLDSYQIIEYIFNGVGCERDEVLYAEKLEKFRNGLVAEFLEKERDNVFLYSIEHRKKSPSKLRTFKGLIDKKKVDQGLFVQAEIKLRDDQTIISFIASLVEGNVDYLSNFFLDDSTCFVIKSNNDYLNKEFLNLILSTLNLNGNTQLDYLKLLHLFCSKSDIIYRIGGDSGEDYWSLQKFIKTSCQATNGS